MVYAKPRPQEPPRNKLQHKDFKLITWQVMALRMRVVGRMALRMKSSAREMMKKISVYVIGKWTILSYYSHFSLESCLFEGHKIDI